MLERNCPACNKIIIYKSNSGFYTANKNNSKCRKCTSKSTGFLQRYATKGSNLKENNPFYGKKHSKDSIEKMSLIAKNRDQSNYRTEIFREKQRNLVKNKITGTHGKTVYSIWLKKYGKEEADKKLLLLKEKHSKNNSGSGNPMFGKPTPKGSGNGWKGWYKNYYFRSLRELCYILELDENKIEWKSAEFIRIPYKDYLGRDRTYSPDFLLKNKLIEIKPVRLHNTPLILLKTKAGIKYAEENNLTYEIIDVKIDKDLINKNIDKINFSKNYKEKFEKWNKK